MQSTYLQMNVVSQKFLTFYSFANLYKQFIFRSNNLACVTTNFQTFKILLLLFPLQNTYLPIDMVCRKFAALKKKLCEIFVTEILLLKKIFKLYKKNVKALLFYFEL